MQEREHEKLLPIDQFLSTYQVRPGEAIEVLERDDRENYLRFSLKQKDIRYGGDRDEWEYFISVEGESRDRRCLDYDAKFIPYPRALIEHRGDMVCVIHQHLGSRYRKDFDDSIERLGFEFSFHSPLTENFLVDLGVEFDPNRLLDLVRGGTNENYGKARSLSFLCKERGSDNQTYSERKSHSGLVHVGLIPGSGNFGDDEEEFLKKLGFSYQVESKDGKYKFAAILKALNKEITCNFPDWLDTEQWDRKVTAEGREWKNLYREMPLTITIKELKGEENEA